MSEPTRNLKKIKSNIDESLNPVYIHEIAVTCPGNENPSLLERLYKRQKNLTEIKQEVRELLVIALDIFKKHLTTPDSEQGKLILDPLKVNHVVRLITHEFYFYMNKPLNESEFKELYEFIQGQLFNEFDNEGIISQNVHLCLSSFSVLMNEKIYNITLYVQGGLPAKVQYFAKYEKSDLDPAYSRRLAGDIRDIPWIVDKATILQDKNHHTVLHNNVVLSQTRGKTSFFVPCDICVDFPHQYGAQNLMQEVQSYLPSSNFRDHSKSLPLQVAHILSSSSYPSERRLMLSNYMIHVDPMPHFTGLKAKPMNEQDILPLDQFSIHRKIEKDADSDVYVFPEYPIGLLETSYLADLIMLIILDARAMLLDDYEFVESIEYLLLQIEKHYGDRALNDLLTSPYFMASCIDSEIERFKKQVDIQKYIHVQKLFLSIHHFNEGFNLIKAIESNNPKGCKRAILDYLKINTESKLFALFNAELFELIVKNNNPEILRVFLEEINRFNQYHSTEDTTMNIAYIMWIHKLEINYQLKMLNILSAYPPKSFSASEYIEGIQFNLRFRLLIADGVHEEITKYIKLGASIVDLNWKQKKVIYFDITNIFHGVEPLSLGAYKNIIQGFELSDSYDLISNHWDYLETLESNNIDEYIRLFYSKIIGPDSDAIDEFLDRLAKGGYKRISVDKFLEHIISLKGEIHKGFSEHVCKYIVDKKLGCLREWGLLYKHLNELPNPSKSNKFTSNRSFFSRSENPALKKETKPHNLH